LQEDLVPTKKSRLGGLLVPLLIGATLSLACGSSGSPGGQGGSGGGSAPAGGTGGGAGTGGSGGGGSGGTAGTGGAPGGSGGSVDAGRDAGGAGGSLASDAATDGAPAARPARVLIYTRRSTPTHDASIPVALKTLSDLFKTVSIEVVASEDQVMFTEANLARFGAVVMVNSNGTPFGTPGTNEASALAAFVRAGGGLAAFHAAANTSYPAGHPLLTLLGAAFQNTGGGVRDFSCAPEGQHSVVATVPNPLHARMDETYVFGPLDAMNQVVMRCDPATGTTKLPASWLREEAAGRVFYTTLGHGPLTWEAAGTFVTTHAWPAILWVLRRSTD
jgi:type 1 glutamine amidotransferase